MVKQHTRDALLALEDGRTFVCRSFTGAGEACGEVVFNTGMSGYQEVLTDPSYRGQLVTMTYPLVGNYGINPVDVESDRIQVAGFLVREYQAFVSNFRATASLAEYLMASNILGVDQLDTRALTRHIRKVGAMRAVVSTLDRDPASLVRRACQIPPMTGRDLAGEVTSSHPFLWTDGAPQPCKNALTTADRHLFSRKSNRFAVVAFDFGIKYNILRCLEDAGCEVIVVPAATPPEIVRATRNR